MKSKLFLGIILIITIISSMIMTVTEGACNYNDGGGIGGSGGESWTKKCYGLISGSGACKKDFGDGWDFAGKEKKCKNGGFDAHYLCKKKVVAQVRREVVEHLSQVGQVKLVERGVYMKMQKD